MSLTAKVIGFAKVQAKAELKKLLIRALLQRTFEREGADLVEKIQAAVPVRKGNLQQSVRLQPAKRKPGVVIIAGGTAATARGPNLDEALLTEYGTRKEAAEPFFYPTIEQEKRSLVDRITGAMKS